MAIHIKYWKYSEGGTVFDAKAELDEICRTYQSCSNFFREFVRALAKSAVKGTLSPHSFELRKLILEGLKTIAPEEIEPFREAYAAAFSDAPPSAEIEVSDDESWARWRDANSRAKLSQILSILLAWRPPCEQYVASALFPWDHLKVRLTAKFRVERGIKDSVVTFWSFESTEP